MPRLIRRLVFVGVAFVMVIFVIPRIPWPSAPHASQDEKTSVPAPAHSQWGEGIERVTYAYSTTTRGKIDLFGFDQGQYRVEFRATTTGLTMDGWMKRELSAVAGINGTYFHEDFSPSGLLVIGGEASARQFDWDKSGLIVAREEKTEIQDTLEDPADVTALENAAQSYPFLIRNGEPAVEEDSGLTARRSFIGTDRDGRVWIGVLPNGELSLYELAQHLDELDIPWKHVLNLDGGPSSGLFVRKPDHPGRDSVSYASYGGVPNVIVIEPR